MQEKLNWQCSEYNRAIFFKNTDNATSVGHYQRLFKLEDAFKNQFGLSDKSDIHWILGTAIICDVQNNSILISQKNYIEDIAAKFHSRVTISYKTPIPLSINFTTLANEDEEPNDTKKFPYHELIGSLMYAATVSQPDIAYSVNKLARYTTKPS